MPRKLGSPGRWRGLTRCRVKGDLRPRKTERTSTWTLAVARTVRYLRRDDGFAWTQEQDTAARAPRASRPLGRALRAPREPAPAARGRDHRARGRAGVPAPERGP